MNKRLLGNTGITVSEVAFGCVEIGLPYGIGVNSESQMLSTDDAIKLLHSALDKGINFFDTARQYGKSEYILGEAFKDRRKDVVIATKCRHIRTKEKKIPEDSELQLLIETSLQESLDALQTNYVDVFMLHDGDPEVMLHPVVISSFKKFKKEGKIRATGVSTYSPVETQTAINSEFWNVVQVPFNLMDQRHGHYFDMANEAGVGIIIRSVLMKGLLSNRGKDLHIALKNVESHIQEYNKLKELTARELPDVAVKFALSYPQVSAVLIGIDKMEYLVNAINVADGKYFNMAELTLAKELQFPQPDFLNLHQWSVNGWLK